MIGQRTYARSTPCPPIEHRQQYFTNPESLGYRRGHVAERLYGQVLVPPAVEQEIQRLQTSRSRFAGVTLPDFAAVLFVRNTPLATALKLQLDSGEAEAIALAVEQSAARLLVDEHRARVVASRLGVRTIGCLGILLEAKQQGLITTIRPLLEKLEAQAGFWVGGELRSQVLSAAGE